MEPTREMLEQFSPKQLEKFSILEEAHLQDNFMGPTKEMFEQFSPEQLEKLSILEDFHLQDLAETMESGPIASIQSGASKRIPKVLSTSKTSVPTVGGFSTAGRGSPLGDAKDVGMRGIADSSIVEIADLKASSSSKTTLEQLGKSNQNSKTVMLARNSEFRGKPLLGITKNEIKSAFDNGATFVVGDMPNVDSQFIDYLNSINAPYTVYHAGKEPRINLSKTSGTKINLKGKTVAEKKANITAERVARGGGVKVGTPIKSGESRARALQPRLVANIERLMAQARLNVAEKTVGHSIPEMGDDMFGGMLDESGGPIGELRSTAPRRVSGVLPHVEPELAGVVGRSSGSSASTQAVAKAVAEGKYKNIKMAALGSALAFGGVYTANRDKRKRYR